MGEERQGELAPDELEEAELLPDREAMSVITPGVERPVPLDGGAEDTDPRPIDQ